MVVRGRAIWESMTVDISIGFQPNLNDSKVAPGDSLLEASILSTNFIVKGRAFNYKVGANQNATLGSSLVCKPRHFKAEGHEPPRPAFNVHYCPSLPYMGRSISGRDLTRLARTIIFPPPEKGRSDSTTTVLIKTKIAGALSPAKSANADTEGIAPRCGGFGINPLNDGGRVCNKKEVFRKRGFCNPRDGRAVTVDPATVRTLRESAQCG